MRDGGGSRGGEGEGGGEREEEGEEERRREGDELFFLFLYVALLCAGIRSAKLRHAQEPQAKLCAGAYGPFDAAA